MQIVDVKLGPDAECKMEVVGGVVQLQLSEGAVGLQGGLTLNVPLKYYLDVLSAKANNPVVTSIVGVVEGVLAAMP